MQAMASWRALKNKANTLASRFTGLLWCRPSDRILLHEGASPLPPTQKLGTIDCISMSLLKLMVLARPRFYHARPGNTSSTHR